MQTIERQGGRTVAALAALIVIAGACEKAAGKPTPPPEASRAAEAVAAPAGLIGVLAVRSVDDLHGGLAEFLTAIEPSAAAMVSSGGIAGVLASTGGVSSLDGADLDKPIRILLLDGKAHAQSKLLLVAVADPAALKKSAGGATLRLKGGWALVGGAREVASFEGWAFALAATKPAAAASFTFYPGALLAAYRTEIESAKSMMSAMMSAGGSQPGLGGFVEGEIDAFVAVLEQTDEVVVDATVGRQGARLDVTCTAKAGSTFAQVIAAQRPSDFALLRTLPADEAVMTMGGRMVLGPARGPMIDLFGRLFGAALADKDTRALMNTWADSFSGDMAMTMGGAKGEGLSFQEVFGVEDADAARQGLRAFMRLLAGDSGKPRVIDIMGIRETISFATDAGKHDGVALDRWGLEVDASAMGGQAADMMKVMYPGGMSGFSAVFDRTLAVAFGSAAERHLHAIIDATRGRGARALPAGLARAVEDAKARKDSTLMFMDLGRLVAVMTGRDAGPSRSGLVWSFGFGDGRMRMRLELPAEHIQEIKSATN